ncbi:uncharacterized protein LOC110396095 isoform X2 [Numida meleagris]|uniref:uncharacterized protein LOC110396095 isoform X2 n=1 Tax=Numida meleagris TaxID=8996 RepID=UPI000B3DEC46|nr:uncharacterized protein LOC110396095 isoform X2 [Numida meleagris]
MSAAFVCSLYHRYCPITGKVSLGLKVHPKDSIKWLPKSPKLYGGHNWSSQGSRWTSLKGKEGFHGGNLYKLSSANGKWREGRISPEQEAEELEDPDEDEPVSKFSGSLFDNDVHVRDQRNSRAALQERHKSAMKGKTAPGTNSKTQAHVSAGSLPGEGGRFLEESRAADGTQPPLKGILITRLPKDCPADVAGMQAGERAAEGSLISEPSTHNAGPTEASSKGNPFQTLNHVITIPRIILTRPSTSDEDTDQLPPDPDDFEMEDPDGTERRAYSDCLNSAFYPP